MKKLVLLMAVIFFGLGLGCSDEGGDTFVYNYTIQPPVTDELGSVQIIVLADISQGREGWLTILQDTDGPTNIIEDIAITVQNGQQFGFDLTPGDYWMTVTGLGFTSYAEFTVKEGETSVVVMELYEWPVYTWYPILAASSPSGLRVPGNGIPIMEFYLAHDQVFDLKPDHFTFTLNYSPGVSLNACYLTYLDTQSGFYVNLGAAPILLGQVYFGLTNNSLADISVVPAYGQTKYRLACDVNAGMNDTLQTSLTDFLGQPNTTAQQIWNLPINGGVLAF